MAPNDACHLDFGNRVFSAHTCSPCSVNAKLSVVVPPFSLHCNWTTWGTIAGDAIAIKIGDRVVTPNGNRTVIELEVAI